MAEVTITVPAEHVERLRYHAVSLVNEHGHPIDHLLSDEDDERFSAAREVMVRARAAIENAQDVLAQLDGTGDAEVSADREFLGSILREFLGYTAGDFHENDPGEMRRLADRVHWITDALATIDREAVPA